MRRSEIKLYGGWIISFFCVVLGLVYYMSLNREIDEFPTNPELDNLKSTGFEDVEMNQLVRTFTAGILQATEVSAVKLESVAQKIVDTKIKLLAQARALDFIPRHFTDCRDMFPNQSDISDFYLPAKVASILDEVSAKVRELGGTKEGYSAERREQALMAVKLAALPFVETICETGFNAGHSSAVWLAVNPIANLYSFDVGYHSYGRPMADFLAAKFPGRFHIMWGDSAHTLPKFRNSRPDVACDLVVIDGGHHEAGALNDFNNFQEMASCHNILFFDNWPEPHTFTWHPIGKVWEEKKRMGELAEIFKCGNPTGKEDFVGFSVGRIVVDSC